MREALNAEFNPFGPGDHFEGNGFFQVIKMPYLEVQHFLRENKMFYPAAAQGPCLCT